MSFLRYITLILLYSSVIFSQDKIHLGIDLAEKKLPFGLNQKIVAHMPLIGVALSGGGARAISQIGILKSLQKNNIHIDYLVGTSMGSVIGGLYAAGYCLNEIDSILTSKNWEEFTAINETSRRDLFVDKKITEDRSIFSIRFNKLSPIIPNSINTGQKVLNFFNLLFINAPLTFDQNFDQMLYDFRAVATDLINGQTIELKNGSISKSLRASSSVSFLLPPVSIDSLLLVDGGLVANVPVEVTRETGADIVIAANTTSPLKTKEELNFPWMIADQTVSIPISIMTLKQLQLADIVIQPYLGDKKNNEFTNLEGIIELGYDAVNPHLKTISAKQKQLFSKKQKDFEIFYKNVIPSENDSLAECFLSKISKIDSISNHQLEFMIAEEFNKGDYQNLSGDLIRENNNWKLTINEKKNPTINSVNVFGTTLFEEEFAEQHFISLINKPYNSNKILNSLISFIRKYRQRGIALATVDKIIFDEKEGALNIYFWEGVVNKIVVEGNVKTNSTVILRELPFLEGDPLIYSQLEEGLENLRTTELFDEIDLHVDVENYSNTLIIKVVEKLSAVLRFGLKIDNEYFTQFSFDLRDENLFGTGSEIGASFFVGPRNRNITLEQKSSRIFDTYLTYNIKGFYNSLDITTYSDEVKKNDKSFSRIKDGEYAQISYGASFSIGAQVRKFGNIYGEIRYLRDKIENKLNSPVGGYIVNIASIRGGFKIDSQNKYPYPTSGFLLETYYETSQKIFESNIAYSKLFFDYNYYFSINSLHTIRLRGLVGFADETLPLSQQFSFGGQSSFSGYREYDFRGRQIFISSLEYRLKLPFKFFFDTYLKTKYDLGSIWRETEEIKLKNLRHGASATISFDTPVGPADFSVSKSFLLKNKIPNSTISWGETLFYFTIGFYY